MVEYVSREAVRDMLHNEISSWGGCSEEIEALLNANEKLFELPAADVVAVKHGKWDDTGRYKFPGGSIAVRCSECGCCLTAGEYKMNVWNYCPVCGARMDGGTDNGP